jgi:hypothetical protein
MRTLGAILAAAVLGLLIWAVQLPNTPPVLQSFEDAPPQVLLGHTVTFRLFWSGGEGDVRAVVCRTKGVTSGSCVDGAWAVGSFSHSSPSTATFHVPNSDAWYNEMGDGIFYYPFVCDRDGRCSPPIHTTGTYCPYFDVLAERGDEPGILECDQTPPANAQDV